jgi:hypothetical protein
MDDLRCYSSSCREFHDGDAPRSLAIKHAAVSTAAQHHDAMRKAQNFVEI